MQRRPLLGWAVAGLAAAGFVLLAWLVRRGPVRGELRLNEALERRAPPYFDDISVAASVQQWLFVVLAVVVVLVLFRQVRAALVLLVVEPLTEGLTLASKLIVNRQMPGQPIEYGLDRIDGVLLYPSGHVTRVTVTLGLLLLFVVWRRPWLRVPFLALSAILLPLIGIVQMSVGGHLPLDVFGGYFLGTLVATITWLLVGPRPRELAPPSTHTDLARRRPTLGDAPERGPASP